MLGALLTFLFALGSAGVGQAVLVRLMTDRDPALRFGVGGLFGLAAIGLITLPIALLPQGTHWGVFLVGLIALAGYIPLYKLRPSVSKPEGLSLLIILGAVLAAFCALVGVLSPSDAFDWDSLAYHLAVPKIWILGGQMHFISFIHHSNFPLTVDGMFLWGESWGGEAGAKAFMLTYAVFGAIALFGFTRERFGIKAGWWALLAYAGVPLLIWESGTAYIDSANGLFAAFGILFAAEFAADSEKSNAAWLSGIFLGFAAGSKYTGLQTIVTVLLVLTIAFVVRRSRSSTGSAIPIRQIALIGLVAGAIAAPWYVRNVINTGNPVYPFFYSVFKGKNWDAFSDRIYKEQQQTFGTGRANDNGKDYVANPIEPARFGSAVLGLTYEPGRYVDPAPTSGSGFPFQSLGAIPLAALLLWMFSGQMSMFEATIGGVVWLSFGIWFFLSEQARYMLGLAFPLAVLAGAAMAKLRMGAVLAGAAAVQLIASIVVLTRYGPDQNGISRFSDKLKVVLGTTATADYEGRFNPFYGPAQDLNRLAKDGRVALFDEVFGYFLDVPYFWANPGHTTEMGYESMTSSDQFVDSLHRLGITYVYINLGLTFGNDETKVRRWQHAAGMAESALPYSVDERARQMVDPRDKYKVLLAEAIASGRIRYVSAYGMRGFRLLFEVEK